MYKFKPTEEQQKLFNENFDREAYEKAKTEILSYIGITDDDGDKLYEALNGYDIDYHYDDDYRDEHDEPIPIGFDFYCEKELDRTSMPTDADYIGVEFTVVWSARHKKAWIDSARLYVADLGQVCSFDPDTCEILEWLL